MDFSQQPFELQDISPYFQSIAAQEIKQNEQQLKVNTI